MDPMTLAAIGGTAVNVGASLLGEWWASADEKARAALEEEAYRLYGDVSAPALEKVLAGKLGPSAMEGIPKDAGNKNARNLALQRMMEVGLQGGMDAGSLQATEEARRAGAATAQQGTAAVRADAQRRGLGGAGEVVGMQVAQQRGADRASLGALQGASDARARALQALAQGGGMAAQAEGQDFDQAARVAESRDRIAQFNANMAERANYYNAGLAQQNFDNQLSVTDRKYEAKMGQAGAKGRSADRKRKMVGGIGQAAGTLGPAIGQRWGK